MIAFTVPLFIFVLLTSNCLHGQPLVNDYENERAIVLPRLKRAVYAVPQHQTFDNHRNDEFLNNFDDTLFSLMQRTNHKRLIDF